VHRCAFGDHGAVVAELVDELRELVASDDGLSLVAEHCGDVIGHVMFTRSLLDAPRRLLDVQVLKSCRGTARTSATGGRIGADTCRP
jgi:putative acetyltransferase